MAQHEWLHSCARMAVTSTGMEEITLENCLGLHLVVESTEPLRISLFEPGLLCIGVGPKMGLPALVAICDFGHCTRGVSVRDALFPSLLFLAQQWRLRVPVRKANVLMFDDEGQWRHVATRWGNSPQVDVGHQVRWPGCKAGASDAVSGAFGLQGARLMAVLQEMVVNDSMGFGAEDWGH